MSSLSRSSSGDTFPGDRAGWANGRKANMGADGGAILLGQALSSRDQRKSVACRVSSWQFMQPVVISVWSNVSGVTFVKAESAPVPGNVLFGVPDWLGGIGCGRLSWSGHCVMTS